VVIGGVKEFYENHTKSELIGMLILEVNANHEIIVSGLVSEEFHNEMYSIPYREYLKFRGRSWGLDRQFVDFLLNGKLKDGELIVDKKHKVSLRAINSSQLQVAKGQQDELLLVLRDGNTATITHSSLTWHLGAMREEGETVEFSLEGLKSALRQLDASAK